MINQVMVKPVENTALAAAAASFLDVVSELHAARRNVVTDLIGGAPFTQWDHYPSEDFHDPATGALFFYHAHDPAARIDGEHGHFHCFVEQSRIAPTALPIFKPARRNGSKALCHLVAVTIDLNGLPAALFTTNQWVTDEWLYPAQAVIPLIDAFRFPSSQDTSLVSRWLTELVALFRPQIVELLVQRDLTLRCNGKRATRKVRRRSIEVVSQLAIDVDAQIAEITGSSETCR